MSSKSSKSCGSSDPTVSGDSDVSERWQVLLLLWLSAQTAAALISGLRPQNQQYQWTTALTAARASLGH
jgi:hypothetical protein